MKLPMIPELAPPPRTDRRGSCDPRRPPTPPRRTAYGVCRVGPIAYAAILAIAAVSSLTHAATVNLAPILNSQTNITLQSENTYYLANEYHLTRTTTIAGSGARVTMQNGPLNARGGCTLTIGNCILNGSGWGVLAAGQASNLILNNCTVTGSASNTGILVAEGSTLSVDNSTVQSCWIGVNMVDSASGVLHGIVVQSCDFAVQLGRGTLTADRNSRFTGGHGTGLAINEGGSLVVRDSTFTYYMNAIDIQPHSPGGTADVERCAFYSADASALSVVDAHDVRFANCLVQDTLADGIFYVRSTGAVQNCRVLNSAMTGVAFLGCANGVAILDSLVSGSGDQGVAVVTDGASPAHPSLNVQIANNTIVDSTLCNIFVDGISTAYIQGNILSQAPDASARFHGSHGSTMDTTLIVENSWGIELRNSDLLMRLSAVVGHNEGGILVYQSAHPTLRHIDFRNNDRGPSIDRSVFVNEGAVPNLRGCTLGQIGERGLYNNAAGCATDARDNYWGTPLGPKVQGSGPSPGATVEWNPQNGSSVAFSPWLAGPRVASDYSAAFSLSPGSTGSWDSAVGVSIGLTARANAGQVGGQIVGALRCLDATGLDGFVPPENFIPGHLYVVWVAYPLREIVSQGAVTFHAPDLALAAVDLWRPGGDGHWAREAAVWSPAARTLVVSYSDASSNGLNGIFALGVGPSPTPTPRPSSAHNWVLFD